MGVVGRWLGEKAGGALGGLFGHSDIGSQAGGALGGEFIPFQAGGLVFNKKPKKKAHHKKKKSKK